MPKKSAAKTGAKKTSAKTVTGKAAKTSTTSRPTKPRRLKPGQYKTLKLQKRIKHPVKLPNVWQLTKRTARSLWRNKRLFIGITLVYGFINFGLAQGFSNGTDVASLKHVVDQVFTGHFGFLLSSLSIFVALVGTAGSTTDQAASTYQMILAIVASLATIWALRQTLSDNKTRLRIRDPYYRGMTPLIPFLLVLTIIGIQLLPLIIGSTLYSLVINNGIAIYAIEKIVWGLLFAMLGLLSLYMMSSSVFALYIVTLPDMTPMKALRSARTLVRYRRWTVLRKILFLPLLLLVIALVVTLPVIILVTPLARWVFLLLTMFALLAVHAYMYNLYRELLNE